MNQCMALGCSQTKSKRCLRCYRFFCEKHRSQDQHGCGQIISVNQSKKDKGKGKVDGSNPKNSSSKQARSSNKAPGFRRLRGASNWIRSSGPSSSNSKTFKPKLHLSVHRHWRPREPVIEVENDNDRIDWYRLENLKYIYYTVAGIPHNIEPVYITQCKYIMFYTNHGQLYPDAVKSQNLSRLNALESSIPSVVTIRTKRGKKLSIRLPKIKKDAASEKTEKIQREFKSHKNKSKDTSPFMSGTAGEENKNKLLASKHFYMKENVNNNVMKGNINNNVLLHISIPRELLCDFENDTVCYEIGYLGGRIPLEWCKTIYFRGKYNGGELFQFNLTPMKRFHMVNWFKKHYPSNPDTTRKHDEKYHNFASEFFTFCKQLDKNLSPLDALESENFKNLLQQLHETLREKFQEFPEVNPEQMKSFSILKMLTIADRSRASEDSGNCLFEAVSQAVLGTPNYHSELRAGCVDYMIRHYEHFHDFGVRVKYLLEMSELGTWGGEPEIHALAGLLGVNIVVRGHDIRLPLLRISTPNASRTVNLLYCNYGGNVNQPRNHYVVDPRFYFSPPPRRNQGKNERNIS